MTTRRICLSAAVTTTVWLTMVSPACSQIIDINITFDTDSGGNPLTAPPSFSATNSLTNLYSSLGVTFSGPASMDGGGILNVTSNFGVPTQSGTNFLAFNRDLISPNGYINGGVPTDPETIVFSNLQTTVSIFASGGDTANSFSMQAFDDGNALVGSSSGPNVAGAYVQLSIISASNIRRVVLTSFAGDNSFVYDSLFIHAVPEPSSFLLMGGAGIAWFCRRKRHVKSTTHVTAA